MCNYASLFVELYNWEKPEEVTLGDGHVVKANGRGVVKIEIECQRSQKVKNCVLQDVFYVPSLSYNLVSVSKATKSGKTVTFDEDGCHILDECQKLIANAKRVGNLYYLGAVHTSDLDRSEIDSKPYWAKCEQTQMIRDRIEIELN